MDREKISARSVAKKTKPGTNGKPLSDRYIGHILAGVSIPTVDVVDRIAAVFELEGWQMMVPGVAYEAAKRGKLSRLISFYGKSSDEGKGYIDRVAEHEAQYSLKK